MKKSLWKLRNKEKKYERKPEKVVRLEQLEKMENKLDMIDKVLEELREDERKQKEEKKRREELLLKEWRKKVERKTKKENEKKELLEKQKLLSQRWGMIKWVTEFIKANQETWETQRKEKEKELEKELEAWNKSKRFEKIQKLKEKWRKENSNTEIEIEKEIPDTDDNKTYDVWRKKEKPLETENNQGLDTIEKNHDTMPVQFEYEVTKLIKKPKLDLDNRTEKSENSENKKLPIRNVGSQSKITQFCGLRKVNTTPKMMDSQEASAVQSTSTTSRTEDSQEVSVIQSNLTPSATDDSHEVSAPTIKNNPVIAEPPPPHPYKSYDIRILLKKPKLSFQAEQSENSPSLNIPPDVRNKTVQDNNTIASEKLDIKENEKKKTTNEMEDNLNQKTTEMNTPNTKKMRMVELLPPTKEDDPKVSKRKTTSTKKKDNTKKRVTNVNIKEFFKYNVSQGQCSAVVPEKMASQCTKENTGNNMAQREGSVKLYQSNILPVGLPTSPDLDQKVSLPSKHLVKGFCDQTTNKDPGN